MSQSTTVLSWALLLLACADVTLCIDQAGGITVGDYLPQYDCLCSTSYSLNVRYSPCVDASYFVLENRCVRYAGQYQFCAMYGYLQLVPFFKVYVNRQEVWAPGPYLRRGYAYECARTDAIDVPYSYYPYIPPYSPYSSDKSASKRRLRGGGRSAGTVTDIMNKWSCYLLPVKTGNRDRINDLFDIMNYNGDDYLTVKEFHDFPYHTTVDITSFENLVTANDADGNGKLDIDEFVNMFLNMDVDCSGM